MNSQRGLTLIVYALLLLAILGAAYTLLQFVDAHWETSAGVIKGEGNTQRKWDQANETARLATKAQQEKNAATARTYAAFLLAAQDSANTYAQQLDQERAARRREGKPSAFALCPKPNPIGGSENVTAPTQATDVTFSLRLSWGFVRDWDAVHTDKAGKPIFGVQPGGAAPGGQADTPAPVTINDAGDNHAANAKLWSEDRRRLNTLVEKIKHLQDTWFK